MKTTYLLIAVTWIFLFGACNNSHQKANNGKDEFVPQWAKGIVWYQIFPERFRNGDPSNDPTFDDIRGAWPHDTVLPWQIHPWKADWYELQPYEKANGKDIWYNITRRRFGGDLQGIIDKLDYLQELGIGGIYLNPVFWAPSHHKYDAICYHHIDPTFGPDPAGDKALMASEVPDDTSSWVWTKADLLALQLIKELHKRGMKIIFDGVFNHMGVQSFAFQDVIKNQQNSGFKDWFIIESFADSATDTPFKYKGWFGVQDLPELKEDENGIVRGPKDYIFSSVKRWMKPVVNGSPAEGIDGWRLDVTFCVQHAFWKEFRKFCKYLNPNCYLTAEVIDSIDNIKPYLQGDEFDAVMNYNFAFNLTDYFVNDNLGITSTVFAVRMEELQDAYPKGVSYVLQNLLGSHDANRIASQIVNKDLGSFSNWGEYFQLSKATNKDYITTQPSIDDYHLLKQLVIFQMTWPGAPMVYYGDEVGMWGANDPDCRKPMLWDDMIGDRETFLPDGSKLDTPNVVYPNQDLIGFYKKMIRLHNLEPALKYGETNIFISENDRKLLGFTRTYNDEKLYIVFNSDTGSQRVPLQVNANGDYIDLINHRGYRTDNKSMNIEVRGKWGAIIKKN